MALTKVTADVLTLSANVAIDSPVFSNTASFPDGSAAAPSIFRAGDTNTGFYFPAADTVNFAEGGTGYRVGFRNVPAVGTKTSSYTLTAEDVGKYVKASTGSSIIIPNSVFAEGDEVFIFNDTSGEIVITFSITTAYIAGNNTAQASLILSTRSVATILFTSSTSCVVQARGGGLTLLDTKTLNNTVDNYTFTSISGSYTNLLIVGESLQGVGGSAKGFNIQLNGDTGGNYSYTRIRGLRNDSVTVESVASGSFFYTGNCFNDTDDTNGWGQCEIYIYNYAATSNRKGIYSRTYCMEDGTSLNSESNFMNGSYNSTSAISSIKLASSTLQNMKSGTIKLYGVS